MPGESFATSACAKQKPVHYAAVLAKTINDKNADMDNYAVPPPEYRAGGDSGRVEPCQQNSQTFTITTTNQAPGNWKRLDHQAPGDWLKIRQTPVKGKCIYSKTLMENST